MIELKVGQEWEFASLDGIFVVTKVDRKEGRFVLKEKITGKYYSYKMKEMDLFMDMNCTLLTEETKETIVSPNHYIGEQGLEVETVLQNFVPRYNNCYVSHRVASSIEYILRAPLKNGLEDLKKARRNLDQAIEYIENNKITKL